MLNVTLDLWPSGDSSRSRTLAVINVANVEEYRTEVGDYEYDGTIKIGPTDVAVKGHVESVPRYPGGYVLLLRRVLDDVEKSVRVHNDKALMAIYKDLTDALGSEVAQAQPTGKAVPSRTGVRSQPKRRGPSPSLSHSGGPLPCSHPD